MFWGLPGGKESSERLSKLVSRMPTMRCDDESREVIWHRRMGRGGVNRVYGL